MGNTKPYTEAHAIAGVDIVVMFDRDFGAPIRKDLIKAFDRHLATQSFEKKRARSGAAVWRRSDSDGDRLEEVHLHEGFMHVVAFEYRGWANSRDQALSRLSPLLTKLQGEEIEGVSVGLAYIDVFLNDSGPYDATDVFSRNSSLLAASIFDAGPVWKQVLHSRLNRELSLFSNISIEAKYVSSDDAAESEEGDKAPGSKKQKTHATEIAIKLSSNKSSKKPSAVQWSVSELKTKLDYMHGTNKELMLELLSDDMVHQIGLKE